MAVRDDPIEWFIVLIVVVAWVLGLVIIQWRNEVLNDIVAYFTIIGAVAAVFATVITAYAAWFAISTFSSFETQKRKDTIENTILDLVVNCQDSIRYLYEVMDAICANYERQNILEYDNELREKLSQLNDPQTLSNVSDADLAVRLVASQKLRKEISSKRRTLLLEQGVQLQMSQLNAKVNSARRLLVNLKKFSIEEDRIQKIKEIHIAVTVAKKGLENLDFSGSRNYLGETSLRLDTGLIASQHYYNSPKEMQDGMCLIGLKMNGTLAYVPNLSSMRLHDIEDLISDEAFKNKGD